MQEPAKPTDETSPGLFPIRTVSRLTGVNSITLRAWESRYGLIEPIRKPSGHRLYTQEHIDLINRIVGLLDKGMRIGQVKDEVLAEASDEDSSTGEQPTYWRRYVNGMIAASIRFDEQALERIYSEALSFFPVATVTENLLTPLLRELGERWVSGQGSVAEEHFFGVYLRNKLGARFHHQAHTGKGPKLLLACLPGDLHEIGLLLFALAASDHGFQTILLGANMPLDEFPPVVKKTECDALVLSGIIEPSAEIIKDQIPRLVQSLRIPVFMGGRIAASNFDALKKTGVHLLGVDIETGIKQVSKILNYSTESETQH